MIKTFAAHLVFAFLVVASATIPAQAVDNDKSAETIWRLLDYVAVDYRGAVGKGQILSSSEYAEMTEFVTNVRARLEVMPKVDALPSLLAEADALVAQVAQKAEPDAVAKAAHKLADDLLAAYPVAVAPSAPPDLALGAALYTKHCAECHGETGHADGPGAAGLDPPPIAFADLSRARERSVFGLYQVINQGLDGTAMKSFASLPAQDRWALALYVGRFAFGDPDVQEGERLWNSDAALRAKFPNLAALTQTTPAALAAEIGDQKAMAVSGYLRNHPEAIAPETSAALAIVRARLADTLSAVEHGDYAKAGDLALSAYLDGFEQVEPTLGARDAQLMRRIEAAMIDLRAKVREGASADEIKSRIEEITASLDAAERALAPHQAESGADFAGALTILLREGVEALLIVVAMLAFLQKAGRTEVVAYVHGGWIAALAAGVLTWAAATYLISVSGAQRELTEGIGSLFAAVVLVSVGIWMHGKAQADAWQTYIRETMSRALSRGSAWFLFGLAFVVVYREVFETILFYMAMWNGGSRLAILAGAGLGAATLVVIAWALLRYSRKLPIAQFFLYSSGLIAVLAVVLVGKGIAALQEAGWLAIKPVAGIPRIDFLGVFPTWETLIGQIAAAIILAVAFWLNSRPAKAQTS